MAGKRLFSRIFRRSKQSKQKSCDGEKADLVPLDDTKTESTQAPQTEPQTQYEHNIPTVGHEQTMTPFSGGTTQEDSASKRSVALIDPKLLWDKAYDSLKEDDPELVKAYERILSCELMTPTASPLSDIQPNRIEQKDTELRRSQMRQLVGRGLAKTEHEAKIKQGAGHVVDVALAANNTISTALKECPEAALAWTGITFALQMITNPIKETETNRAGIDYVVRKMDWYWNLSSHLLKRRDLSGNSYVGLQFGLRDQIIYLYKALLSYQMKSVCSYYRNRGLVFLKDLVQLHDWDGQLHDIREAVTAVLEGSKEYSTQQIVDFHEEETRTLQNIFHDLHHGFEKQAALQKDLQEKNENKKCLQDLRLTDPQHDMERIEGSKGRLLPESSTWILYHPSFTDWRHGETTQLLWMRADPGKGKTMLMISIIKDLQSDPGSTPLSFFLCQATDARLNNATAVIRGLIYKLVHQQPFLISHIHDEYDRAGSKLFEGGNAFVAVSKILHNMLRDHRLNQVYLVVDALDECQSGLEQLLRFIVESLSDPNSQVRWLVSSRHKPEIEKELSDKSKTELNLDKDVENEISYAVKAYIDHQMQDIIAQYEKKYRNIDHETRTQLRNIEGNVAGNLHRKAENTFLWVALVFQQIQARDCDADEILDFVYKMPVGLHEMYNQMMDQIVQLSQQRNRYACFCREVLLIAVNSYRPLQLSEMVALAALPKFADTRKIIQLCGLLSLREEDTVIYFVHQSAKDYLIKHAKPEIISQLFPVGYRKGHQTIMSRSLESMSQILRRDTYKLEHPGSCIADVHPPSPDPLAPIRYACVYWVDHLHEMESHSGMFFDDNGLVDAFLKKNLLHWLEALSLMKSMSSSVSAIAKLTNMVGSLPQKSELFKLVHDLHRFILFNRGVIENAPLQVYYSALIFSPTHSLTRCLFQDEEPKWAIAKSAIASTWGACLQTLEGHSRSVISVVFSSDGCRIASGSEDNTVRVWDADNGDCLHPLQGHSDWVNSVVFSSDGSRIASGSDDNTVRVWDADNGDCLHTLQGHSGPVNSVVFSSDGSRIASGSYDNTIRVWDTDNGDCLHPLQGHSDWVNSVVFSSDGSRIASGSDDNTVRVWDTDNGDCLHTLQGHSGPVNSVVFSSDGSRITSGSDDNTVRVWDTDNGDCLHTLQGHSGPVNSVVFLSDGSRIVSGSYDNTVMVWDVDNGDCLHTLQGHSSPVNSVVFSSDGSRIASGSGDDTVRVWDTDNGDCLHTLQGHSGPINSVVFSSDGSRIASGSYDNTVRVWDTDNGDCLHPLQGHSNSVNSVVFSSDGSRIASGSYDDTVRVWDVDNGDCLHTLQGHSGPVNSVVFSSDGSRIASGSYDNTVRVWDVDNGDCLHTLQGHSGPVNSVVFSSGGSRIASGSYDNTVRVWDVDNGDCLHTLQGHSNSVNSVVFSSDGSRIASGSYDNTVRVWDVDNGDCLHTLQGHSNSVNSVVFSSDGSRIASGSYDNTVRVWDVDNGDCLHTLEDSMVFDPATLGVIAWGATSNTQKMCETPQHHTYGLNSGGTWITSNGQNVIWLPPEYRPPKYRRASLALTSSTMVIGCESGRVLIFDLSNKACL